MKTQAHAARRAPDREQDALKHLLERERGGLPGTQDDIAGALGLGRAEGAAVADSLAALGWAERRGPEVRLTGEGRAEAVRVVRAHRLIETDLIRNQGADPAEAHVAAEKAEHALSAEQADSLADQLGRPRFDPHGDPIPTRTGFLPADEGVALDLWPAGVPARVVHLEDEPAKLGRELFALGLVPEMELVVAGRGRDAFEVECAGKRIEVPFRLAGMVRVDHARAAGPLRPVATLASVREGEKLLVESLSPACVGYERRRLLDLGLVPGATIELAFHGPFRWPAAFMVRGACIALRRDQAEKILVRSQPEVTP